MSKEVVMEFRRAMTEAPTEPGWYYARFRFIVQGSFEREICPTYFDEFGGWFAGDDWPVDNFDWFGAVPTCIESGRAVENNNAILKT